MPPSPPIPIAATFNLTTFLLDVTFDRPLTPQITAAINWTAIASFFRWGAPLPGAALGNHVTITLIKGPGAPFPDSVTYAAAPADVLSSVGVPAARFDDFPLTVIP